MGADPPYRAFGTSSRSADGVSPSVGTGAVFDVRSDCRHRRTRRQRRAGRLLRRRAAAVEVREAGHRTAGLRTYGRGIMGWIGRMDWTGGTGRNEEHPPRPHHPARPAYPARPAHPAFVVVLTLFAATVHAQTADTILVNG